MNENNSILTIHVFNSVWRFEVAIFLDFLKIFNHWGICHKHRFIKHKRHWLIRVKYWEGKV